MNTQQEYFDYYARLQKLIVQASSVIAQTTEKQFRTKRTNDFVSAVDIGIEKYICSQLQEITPYIPILGEEGTQTSDAPTRWIIDPLDGTTNFMHGIPHFAISVALEVDNQVLFGCSYDVSKNELFHAFRGHGAYMNNQSIHVSAVTQISEALMGTGFPYDRHLKAQEYLQYVEKCMKKSQGIRRFGAATLDLAYVAMGRLDGFWEFGLQPWDVAVGILLVEEAGGVISDLDNNPVDINHPTIVASASSLLHNEIIHTLTT